MPSGSDTLTCLRLNFRERRNTSVETENAAIRGSDQPCSLAEYMMVGFRKIAKRGQRVNIL